MKRLLIGMLCAALLLPTVGTEAIAAETQKNEMQEDTSAGSAAEQLKEGTEGEAGTKGLEMRLRTLISSEETEGADAEENNTENTVSAGPSQIIIGGKEYDTPVANAGKDCMLEVPLLNLSSKTVTDIVITPVVSSDVTAWPFEIGRTDYTQLEEKLDGTEVTDKPLERKYTFRWNLKTREDAVSGYTKIQFNVTWKEADGSAGATTLDYFVQVKGTEPKEEETEENTNISTPRVIVTGFTTNPGEVYAGDTFKLTLHLKNTSKETGVKNLLFDIQCTQEGSDAQTVSAAFLPTAGSSTIFVDSIAAGASKDITIELKSKADLAQKPYVIDVHMEYEDSKANPFTETASVSIPVKQEARVDLSSVTMMPESAEVGNEVNVMFSIYNTGKTQLYNVNVKFMADSVTGGDTFLGNVSPGATANVDAYLTAQAATMDDGTVKIQISYEDEEGNVKTIDEQATLFVSEPFYDDMMFEPGMEDMVVEEESQNSLWGIVAAAAVGALVLIVTAVVVIKKKKAKKRAQAELDVLEELDEEL